MSPQHSHTTQHPHTLFHTHLHTHTKWSLATQHNCCDNNATTVVKLQSSAMLIREESVSCNPTSKPYSGAIKAPTFHLGMSSLLFDYLSIYSNNTLRVFYLSASLRFNIRVSSHTGIEPRC